jgi:hypothetical protein
MNPEHYNHYPVPGGVRYASAAIEGLLEGIIPGCYGWEVFIIVPRSGCDMRLHYIEDLSGLWVSGSFGGL